ILDYYINRIYFGKGYFGLEAAARGYFGKSAKQLTLGECAMLAGLIRSPNSASPRRDYQKALEGRDRVLQTMVEEKFITSQQAWEARQKRIRIAPETSVGLNKYFTPLIMQELQEVLQLDENEFPQGLRVYTTLNTILQQTSERAVSETLTQVEWELNQEKNLRKTLENPGPLQAAVLILDAHEGAVQAYVGGRDFAQSQFDRVTMAQRDNGASLYPFLYALAMQNLGWHPASLIDSSFIDKPEIKTSQAITFGNPEKNLNRRFFLLQDALAGNYKTAAIRTAHQIGLANLAQWLKNTGISFDENFFPKTFHDFRPLTLWEMTSLYQILANQGIQKKPFFIRSIRDGKNKLLYRRTHAAGLPQLETLTAQQMTLTLEQNLRDKIWQQDLTQPATGISSFSENQRDAWFLGYTPRWVTGVWVGYDPSISIGNKTLASKTAIPLWQKIVNQLPSSHTNFSTPSSLIKVEVEKNTGAVQGLAGFAPSPGDAFVYLKQSQLNTLNTLPASGINHIVENEDWSRWLQTLFSNPSELISQTPPEENDHTSIPAVAEYIMPPLRGDIVAADGSTLATTLSGQSLVLPWPSLETANSAEEALTWIKPKLELASTWLGKSITFSDETLTNHYSFQRFQPVIISDLTPEEVSQFNTSKLRDEGFVLQTYPKRVYPENQLLAHTLGYLQRAKTPRIGPYQADLVIYDQYQGAEGLEKIFDTELTGQAGKFVIATTPEGFTQRTAIEKQATSGLNVRTTFDLELQKAVEKSLTNIAAGAVVIMNVTNGAMASH
ncbi:MAG: transglycosylase domain-containing protein, partial [Verrucomicrobiia bacterium]